MGDIVAVKLNTELIRSRLSGLKGVNLTEQGLHDWLCEHGFAPAGNSWWKVETADLANLELDEIVDGLESEVPGDDREIGPGQRLDVTRFGAGGTAGVKPASRLQEKVPRLLIGTHREVTPRWRAIVRRRMSLASWEEALAGEEFVPLADAPGDIVLSGPSLLVQGPNVLVYPVMETILHLARNPRDPDRRLQTRLISDLTFSGMKNLWFAIAMLMPGTFLDPMAEESDQVPVARRALEMLLGWWPQLCALAPRYSYQGLPCPWGSWSGFVRRCCVVIGMRLEDSNSLIEIDPLEAGSRIGLWLAARSGQFE